MGYTTIGFVVLILIVLAAAIRILQEYERGVVFFLGRLSADNFGLTGFVTGDADVKEEVKPEAAEATEPAAEEPVEEPADEPVVEEQTEEIIAKLIVGTEQFLFRRRIQNRAISAK